MPEMHGLGGTIGAYPLMHILGPLIGHMKGLLDVGIASVVGEDDLAAIAQALLPQPDLQSVVLARLELTVENGFATVVGADEDNLPDRLLARFGLDLQACFAGLEHGAGHGPGMRNQREGSAPPSGLTCQCQPGESMGLPILRTWGLTNFMSKLSYCFSKTT